MGGESSMTNLTFISLTKYEHAHTSLVTTDLTSPISNSTDGKGMHESFMHPRSAQRSQPAPRAAPSPPQISREARLAMTRLQVRLTRVGGGGPGPVGPRKLVPGCPTGPGRDQHPRCPPPDRAAAGPLEGDKPRAGGREVVARARDTGERTWVAATAKRR